MNTGQSYGPIVNSETFTIEPILLDNNYLGSTDESSSILPHQVMLLFDDHTYDDDKIINIHKEVERKYGVRGQVHDTPLTTELLQMKVEPLCPNVEMFTTVKQPTTPSVFDKLPEEKMNSHHRSTKHLY